MRGARGGGGEGVSRRRLLSASVCFAHPGGGYVHIRGERFDVALGLRVITTYGDIETLNVHV